MARKANSKRRREVHSPVTVNEEESEKKKEEDELLLLEDVDEEVAGQSEIWVPHQCSPYVFAHAKPHPCATMEAMNTASVLLPPCHYPILDTLGERVKHGIISRVQLEGILYGCDQFMCRLPNGTRKGFLLGDSAGMGKGRQISGMILDAVMRGIPRHVWISISRDLFVDAKRDLDALQVPAVLCDGLDEAAKHIRVSTTATKGRPGQFHHAETPIVLFMTYAELISNGKRSNMNRIEELFAFLGQPETFEGLLVFDECHRAKNYDESSMVMEGDRRKRFKAVTTTKREEAEEEEEGEEEEAGTSATGTSNNNNGSQTADRVIYLQTRFPHARVLYASATAISSADRMGYLVRMGLWGEGTAFKRYQDFTRSLSGVGALEMIAVNLKETGSRVARQLGFRDAHFCDEPVTLSPEALFAYRTYSECWTRVWDAMVMADKWCHETPRGEHRHMHCPRLAFSTAFWGAHQRFFRQLLCSDKVDHVVRLAKQAIAKGYAVVIGLQTTGEATLTRKLASDKKRTVSSKQHAADVCAFQEAFVVSETVTQTREKKANEDMARQKEALRSVDAAPPPVSFAFPMRSTGGGGQAKEAAAVLSTSRRMTPAAKTTTTTTVPVLELSMAKSILVELIKKQFPVQQSWAREPLDQKVTPYTIRPSAAYTLMHEFCGTYSSSLRISTDMFISTFFSHLYGQDLGPVLSKKCQQHRPDSHSVSLFFEQQRNGMGYTYKEQYDDLMVAFRHDAKKQENEVDRIHHVLTQLNDRVQRQSIACPPHNADGMVIAAVAMRDALLRDIDTITFPPSVLDDLIDKCGGPKQVAELTGRTKRLVRDTPGQAFRVDTRSSDQNIVEQNAFMRGAKNVAIISEAASTGISLHADRHVPNRRRRVHIVFELPWAPEQAIQQMGRTHRTNQLSAPIYYLVHTECGGENRLSSALMKKMRQLGALSQGDRRAGGDLFSQHDPFMDSAYGKQAVGMMLQWCFEEQKLKLKTKAKARLQQMTQTFDFTSVWNEVKPLFLREQEAVRHCLRASVTAADGRDRPSEDDEEDEENVDRFLPVWSESWDDTDPQNVHEFLFSALREALSRTQFRTMKSPTVPRFLNRILGLPLAYQGLVFSVFTLLRQKIIQQAKESGLFDRGVQDCHGQLFYADTDPLFLMRDPGTGGELYAQYLVRDRGATVEQALSEFVFMERIMTLSAAETTGLSREDVVYTPETCRFPHEQFYVSREPIRGRIRIALVLPQLSTNVLARVVRPATGLGVRTMITGTTLETSYRPCISENEARDRWEEEYTKSETECSHGPKCVHAPDCLVGRRRLDTILLHGNVLSVWTNVQNMVRDTMKYDQEYRLPVARIQMVRLPSSSTNSTLPTMERKVGVLLPGTKAQCLEVCREIIRMCENKERDQRVTRVMLDSPHCDQKEQEEETGYDTDEAIEAVERAIIAAEPNTKRARLDDDDPLTLDEMDRFFGFTWEERDPDPDMEWFLLKEPPFVPPSDQTRASTCGDHPPRVLVVTSARFPNVPIGRYIQKIERRYPTHVWCSDCLVKQTREIRNQFNRRSGDGGGVSFVVTLVQSRTEAERLEKERFVEHGLERETPRPVSRKAPLVVARPAAAPIPTLPRRT